MGSCRKTVFHLLDVKRNIVAKDEEKTEVISAFFASVFYSKASYYQGSQPPELVDRNGKQNKNHVIQCKMGSYLLHNFDTHKSMGTVGICLRVLRGMAEGFTKSLICSTELIFAVEGMARTHTHGTAGARAPFQLM